MAYGDVIDNEDNSPRYEIAFHVPTGEETFDTLTVSLSEGDPAPGFYGAQSDAVFQDVIDRLAESPYLVNGTGAKTWPAARALTVTPPPDPEPSP